MKACEYVTAYLLKKNVISYEEEEVVEYGLGVLGENILSIVITVLLGSFYKSPISGLLLWLLVFPLRKYAGGFHANTRGRCLLISVGIMLCAYGLFMTWELPMVVFVITTAMTFGIILWLAPVDTPNKLLDVLEQGMYRKRARVILVTEGIVFISACILRYEILYATVTMSYFIVAVLLVAGKVRMKII